MTAVEVVRFVPATSRATDSLTAVSEGARALGLQVETTSRYRGLAPWAVWWGYGSRDRARALAAHLETGGHAAIWDAAYWDRDRKVRVSIDAAHPSAWIMRRTCTADRLHADRVAIRNFWRPDGPIVVAGIGYQARQHYGSTVAEWQEAMIAECRRRWPTRSIYVRHKQTGQVGIEQAIAKSSLVITWHSNVAIDAIRCGIPVVCHDGAAAAVCPATIPDEPQPLSAEVRDQFLANLAYFQWDVAREASASWRFLLELAA